MPSALRKIKSVVGKSPILYRTLKPMVKLFGSSDNLEFTESAGYWEQRYRANGDSGDGSYGRLAKFKADVINEFLDDKSIANVVEFGCGDGAQLSRMKYESYVGVDVSESVVDHCRAKFGDDSSKRFFTTEGYRQECDALPEFELSLSLDVIYHLVEDQVFDSYMRSLFEASSKWVIIYSSNQEYDFPYKHVRHRVFSDWVDEHAHAWKLYRKIPQKFAYDPANASTTSLADFFIFEKN